MSAMYVGFIAHVILFTFISVGSQQDGLQLAFFFFFKILFVYFQRGKEKEKEGEKHQCVWLPLVHPTGDLACNPGMCPDWELNRGPLGLQAGTPSTEPHQPQLQLALINTLVSEK